MALTGLQIYKLLPQTNCKECGFPTCLAFAMKLAAKQAELSACPYVSEESKAQLDAASAPPIRLVTVSSDGRKVEAGNETVLFRHEKTFYHQPGLFVRVRDTDVEGATAIATAVDKYTVDYVGLKLELQGIAVEAASGDPAKFAEAITAVRGVTQKPLILLSRDPAIIEAGLKAAGSKPLIYAADKSNWQAMSNLAKAHKVPLTIRATTEESPLPELAELTQQLKGAGVEDLVLDPGVRGFADSLATMTQIRRLALKKTFRPLGYPIITFPAEGAESPAEATVLAGQHIAKYAGFVVLERFDPAEVYPLLVLRQNIFTDPQKPIQVQPGLYEINAPKADSPVMVTTNFSITYFAVANEVEGSGWPAWLLIADAEGMSVLTAWAAGKFDAERIAKAVKTTGVTDRINHKRIVIPGAVSVLSGELEEELPGWEILVGPREAVDIPNYLKVMWK
jgi:acetyl-CoA decarbonylase/synthase complex subunit gamma